jgi:hypothetical protein
MLELGFVSELAAGMLLGILNYNSMWLKEHKRVIYRESASGIIVLKAFLYVKLR